MGMFEEFVVKAKSAAGVVGEKAGYLVDVSKINISIAEESNELKKKYQELGKLVYDSEKNGTSDTVKVENFVNQIDCINEKISKLKAEVASLKKKLVCCSCGNQNDCDAKYCCKCGKELAVKCEVIPNSDSSENQQGSDELKN